MALIDEGSNMVAKKKLLHISVYRVAVDFDKTIKRYLPKMLNLFRYAL